MNKSDSQTTRQTDRQIDRHTSRQTDSKADRRTDKQTDKQTDRPTDQVTRQQSNNKAASHSISSGRHNMIHGHNMSQWVKTTDLCFKTDSKSVIFSDGSYYVRGSYYAYHWISLQELVILSPHLLISLPLPLPSADRRSANSS